MTTRQRLKHLQLIFPKKTHFLTRARSPKDLETCKEPQSIDLGNFHQATENNMPLSLETLPGKEVLADTLVPSSIWKFLCILLIIVNFKNLPLIWHVSAASGACLPKTDPPTQGPPTQCISLCAPLRAVANTHVTSSAFSTFNHGIAWFSHGAGLQYPQ